MLNCQQIFYVDGYLCLSRHSVWFPCHFRRISTVNTVHSGRWLNQSFISDAVGYLHHFILRWSCVVDRMLKFKYLLTHTTAFKTESFMLVFYQCIKRQFSEWLLPGAGTFSDVTNCNRDVRKRRLESCLDCEYSAEPRLLCLWWQFMWT